MTRHVLIPVDGSLCSSDAAQLGLLLAQRLPAAVTFTTVAAVWPHEGPDSETDQLELQLGAALLEHWYRRGGEHGLQVATRLERAPVADAIVRAAREEQCDLIVMGTHGRSGVNRLLLGSVAEGVARRTQVPVLLVRAGIMGDPLPLDDWARMLVLVDGQPSSAQTLRHAAELARVSGAGVALAYVLPDMNLTLASLVPFGTGMDIDRRQRELETFGREQLDLARREVLAAGVQVIGAEVHWAAGLSVADRIVALAQDRHADALALGTHAHTALDQLLGGVASRVAHRAPVPVLMISLL